MNDYKFLSDPETAAAVLFFGGWRSGDKEMFRDEYALSDDEADQICKELARLEICKELAMVESEADSV